MSFTVLLSRSTRCHQHACLEQKRTGRRGGGHPEYPNSPGIAFRCMNLSLQFVFCRKVVSSLGLTLFGNFLLKIPIGMLFAS